MNLPLLRFLRADFLAFALLFSGVEASGDGTLSRPPTATIDEIRRLTDDQRSRLISLRAEFRSWHRLNLGTPRHEHYVVAAEGPRRYAHLWHGEFPNPDEDPRAFIQLLDGENWNAYGTYFRRYDVSRKFTGLPYTEKILLHPLFESLGWWPPGDPSPPVRGMGRRLFLHDILADDRCRVVCQEQVDGAWCHVVDVAGTDRLWVDCLMGVIPRRILYAGDDHREIASFESGDFREVAPGLFLPYRMRRVSKPRNLDFTTLVERYDVNAVRHNQFRIEAPPGTLIYDRDTDLYQQVPGGFEVMDRLVEWVKNEVGPPVRSTSPVVSGAYLMGLSGGLLGIVASQVRRRPNRPSRLCDLPATESER